MLQETLRSFELDETIKWGAPVYTLNQKNIVGIGAFKSYVGLWFFQGALLKDRQNKLINAQHGKTHAMRQWRFQSLEEIVKEKDTIIAYLVESIDNYKNGKVIKPKKKPPLILPDELVESFSKNHLLQSAFEKFSVSKQREFAEYIDQAKREATKQKRLDKIQLMILNAIGLNDKYRK